MIQYNNFEQTKLAIQRYVEAGDYSRPHIIATEMYSPELKAVISEVKKLPGGEEVRYFTWTEPSFDRIPEFMEQYTGNFLEVTLGGRPEYSHPDQELRAVLSLPVKASRPWFIYMESSRIREWIDELDTDCDINFYAFDKEEWLKASEEINPSTGRRKIDRFYLDFLKQAPDEFILFYPQEKHAGMACNLPSKWVEASHGLVSHIELMLEDAVRADGHKDVKRKELAPLVEPVFNSVFADGDIDWNRLSDILETLPEEVWKKYCRLPNSVKATGLSRVECFKLYAIHEVNCATQSVYEALREFHGLSSAK